MSNAKFLLRPVHRRTLLLMLSAAILASCATSTPLISTVDRSQITDLAMFTPVSHIEYIEKGNQGFYNDSLSIESSALATVLINEMPNLPRMDMISYDDSLWREEVISYFLTLRTTDKKKTPDIFLRTTDNKETPDTFIPEISEKLLKTNGYRYGLLIYTSGFTRAKGNYFDQIMQGVVVGIVSAGMYSTNPIKASSYIACAIIDAEDMKTVFYLDRLKSDTEPLDPKSISKQLDFIFKEYFPAGAVN